MENRESIIRKLNALRAKAYDKSIADTPEAISAMQKFNELMQRYNLTLDELEVKASKIGGFAKTTTKTTDYMRFIVLSIAKVTNTEVIREANTFLFLGMEADIAYANWIYDLISNSLENSTIAYKIGADYHRRINQGEKSDKVIRAFKDGFVYAIVNALEELLNSNKGTGTSLMVLKNDLILSFMQEQGIPTPKIKQKALKVQEDHKEVMDMGYREGSKIKLRKELN